MEDTLEEIGHNMSVDIWRWAAVNGSYIRTTEKQSSLSSDLVTTYDFMGWCKASELESMSLWTIPAIYDLSSQEEWEVSTLGRGRDVGLSDAIQTVQI